MSNSAHLDSFHSFTNRWQSTGHVVWVFDVNFLLLATHCVFFPPLSNSEPAWDPSGGNLSQPGSRLETTAGELNHPNPHLGCHGNPVRGGVRKTQWWLKNPVWFKFNFKKGINHSHLKSTWEICACGFNIWKKNIEHSWICWSFDSMFRKATANIQLITMETDKHAKEHDENIVSLVEAINRRPDSYTKHTLTKRN